MAAEGFEEDAARACGKAKIVLLRKLRAGKDVAGGGVLCRLAKQSGDAMPNDAPKDFETVKYERDREHELKLNEFTHALEMEQLKLLILLNGGAATAVLAFAEKAASGPALQVLMGAVALWLGGLGVGAWATIRMRGIQSNYAKAYHHRRKAVEERRVRSDELGAAVQESEADAALRAAGKENKSFPPFLYASLGLFVAGAVAAALAIAFIPSERAVDCGPAVKTAQP